jgi:hypothetical protein
MSENIIPKGLNGKKTVRPPSFVYNQESDLKKIHVLNW